MFTGIIEELGEVTRVERERATPRASPCARPIAVSDARSTATRSRSAACASPSSTRGADWFTADVMEQTLAMSTLDGVARGPRGQPRARRRASATASAATSCRATSTAPASVLEVRPGDAVARPAVRARRRARAARRRQGLDRGRRRLAHRERASATSPTARWFEVSLIPETLDGDDARRPRASATA